MTCNSSHHYLDYLSGDDRAEQPDADQAEHLASHIEHCEHCQQAIAEHKDYLFKMQRFTVPEPNAGTYARLLRNARLESDHSDQGSQRRHSFLQGFAAASVLAVALFSVNSVWSPNTASPLETVQIENWVEQEITVVINVPVDLSGALLALEMPDELRLQGYSDIDLLSWQVDLKKGANTLTLPITVQPGTDLTQPFFITATVEYQNQYKGFQLPVELKTPQTGQRGALIFEATALHPQV